MGMVSIANLRAVRGADDKSRTYELLRKVAYFIHRRVRFDDKDSNWFYAQDMIADYYGDGFNIEVGIMTGLESVDDGEKYYGDLANEIIVAGLLSGVERR